MDQPVPTHSPSEPPTQAQRLAEALSLHRSGDLDGAEAVYRAILDRDPDHPDALHLLGLIAQARGDLEHALELVERAVARAGDQPELTTNLGNILLAMGRHGPAKACYERALERDPNFALAYRNLGTALHGQGQPMTAIGYYRIAVSLAPDDAQLHFNLASAYHQLGRQPLALEHYQRAIALRPGYADAYFNLGNLLRELRRYDAAAGCYEQLIALQPDHAEAHNYMGQVLVQKRELDSALRYYEKALALRPSFAGTYNNYGNALRALKRFDEALAAYHRALELMPEFPEAHHNMASVLVEQSRLPEAIEHYERAAALKPDYHAARAGAITLRLQICDWKDRDKNVTELDRLIQNCLAIGESSPVDPFSSLSLPFDPQTQLAIARQHATDKVSRTAALRDKLKAPADPPRDRLRIGYVSPNFRNHPTSHLMVRLFGLHDRSRFEIFTYTWGPDDGSEYRRRIARDSDQFIDLTDDSYLDSARRIQRDGVHILVDRAGFTRDNRTEIFALRPAPIQVNYIGFPGTLGADFIDYIVTDRVVTPVEHERLLDEHPVFMPHCYLVTDPEPPVADASAARPDWGLPESGFVFCCFNTNYKIEPTIFDVWMRVLERTPGSVLWLLRNSGFAEENLRREAATRGIDPQRLVFAEKAPKDVHLARHRLADLFLDTLHYNAHTTAVDSLWSGVPLLTCPGETFPARVAASTLTAAGLPELVVPNLREYEELAVGLANDPGRFSEFRRRLQANRPTCPLFDVGRYTRDLERAFEHMWALHEAGRSPQPIELSRE